MYYTSLALTDTCYTETILIKLSANVSTVVNFATFRDVRYNNILVICVNCFENSCCSLHA
jgi:hypothetical protein